MSMTFAEWTEKKKKEKEEASKSNSSNTVSNNSGTKKEMSFDEWSKNKAVERIDQDYINTFIKDANSYFGSAEEDYKNVGYKNASLSYITRRSTWDDLDVRASNIGRWLEQNKDRIDEKTYTSLSDTLSSFKDGASSVLTGFRDASKYYSQWETEEDYNKAVAEAEEYDKKKNLDLDAYQKETERLKAELEKADPTGWLSYGADDNEYDKMKDEIAEREAYYTQAKRIQEGIVLSGVADPNSEHYDTEFDNYTGYNEEFEEDDIFYKAINKKLGGIYEHLEDEEIAIYNYYYAKFGKEKAQEYFDSIEEQLNARKGAEMFKAVEGNWFTEMLFGVVAGVDQFASGIENLFSGDDYYAPSAIQFASGMIKEDLGDNWFASTAYDLTTNISNMLPSSLVGMATGGVGGLITMGASAAGNAKAEMINLGYSKLQANAYGALVGASEALLEKLLGGIVGLSDGGIFTKLGTKVLGKVDHALARAAIQLGGSMLDEFTEEALQTILEPWFASAVTGLDYDAPDIEEVLYSGLLGALTAGAFDIGGTAFGKGAIAENVATRNQGKNLIKQGLDVNKLVELGKDTNFVSADSVAYRLAGKVNENTGAYTIARLFNEMNAQLTSQNQADIIRSLERKGVTPQHAETIATALANEVAGIEMTKAQAKLIEKNPVVTKTIKDVILNENSTVRQRMTNFNEAVFPKSAEATQEATGQAEATTVAENIPTGQSAENKAKNVSESGKTTLTSTGEEVNVQKVTETKGGLKVELDNGMVVSASDLSYSTNAEAMMFDMFSRMEASPTSTNAMMNAFKPSSLQEASLYHVGVPLAYQYGKIGYKEGLKSIKMSQKAKQFAYNRGREDAQANAEAKSKTTEKATEKETSTKQGKVILDKSVPSEAEFTDVQKASMEGIKFVAEVSSLEIHVYASFVENGKTMAYINGKKRKAPNGYYIEGTNKIYIDLNAGNNREGTMLFTLSHEVTHYIAEWNYKGFKELGDFLIKNFGDINAPVHELIEKHIAKKKSSYELDNIPVPSESQLYEEAYEELVADAMSKMFADKQAYVKLADLKKQNKTLWQKLGEAISKLLDKIKSVIGIYTDMSPGAKEAKWIEKFNSEVYGKLQDLYLKAFVEADANYQASSAEETEGVGNRKESGRDDFDWNSEEGQLIATAMDMETCKQMIERTYRIVNPNQYEDTPIYRNGDHWLETVGAEEVALAIKFPSMYSSISSRLEFSS